MQTDVNPSTIRTLSELEQEMVGVERAAEAKALHEALSILVRPSRGWLSTGQAAEKLGVSIPTIKDWIRRGTLQGQPVGSRWRVSESSVDKVLDVRAMVSGMDEDGYPSEEEAQELIRRVRRQMTSEQARTVG